MKGIVFTPVQEMYIKDFAQPLYETIGKEVGGGWIEIVHPHRPEKGAQQPLFRL